MAEAHLRARSMRGNSPGRIPRTPQEATPAWLTEALCREIPGAEVISVRPAGPGTSGTTTRRPLTLAYNQAGAAAGLPRDVFVKCTSSVPQRLMLGLGGLIGGEPGFYMGIRPRLQIEAPAGYFADVDPRSWRSVVLIEDVRRSKAARFWDASTEVTRAQMEELVLNIARLHGSLWQSPWLDRWRWLRTPAVQARLIDALIGLADRTGTGARRAAEVLPAALRGRPGHLYEGMRLSMALAGRPPHTYLHGDLHIANTYRTGQGDMGICDWQVGMRGSWAFDFTYLMATALPTEDRRAWERELLDLYLEQLASSGGVAPSRDDAWLAYRQATFYPYFAWLYTLGRSRLQPRFQPDELALTLIGRIAATIEDLDSLSAIGL